MARNRHGKVFPWRFCRVVLAVAADHPRCPRWCVCKGWSNCTLGVRGRNPGPCRKNTTEMPFRPVSEAPRKGVSAAILTGWSDDSPRCPRWCVCKGWSNCTLLKEGPETRLFDGDAFWWYNGLTQDGSVPPVVLGVIRRGAGLTMRVGGECRSVATVTWKCRERPCA